MYCEHCGQELPDGSKFCGFCGAVQAAVDEAAAPVTPPTQAEWTGVTAEEEEDAIRRSKKVPLAVRLGAVFAVVALVLGGGIFAAIRLGLFSGGGRASADYVVWRTEDEYAFTKNPAKDGGEIEIERLRGDDLADAYAATGVLTEDGKYFYYINRYDSGSATGTLYRAELGKLKEDSAKNEPYIIKIDSDVSGLALADGDHLLYVRKGSDSTLRLCYFNGEESVTLAKNLDSYWPVRGTANDGVIYRTGSYDEGYNLYVVSYQNIDDPVKIATGVNSMAGWQDLDHIVYTKYNEDDYTDTVYLGGISRDAEKIADHAEYADYSSYEKENGFFYTVENAHGINLAQYVSNPYAAEDANVKEPESQDFQKEVTETDYWGNPYTRTETDWDAYDEAWEKYETARDRIYLMEELSDEDNELETYTLCYYDGSTGESTEISSNLLYSAYYGAQAGGTALVAYREFVEPEDKISINKLLEDGYYSAERMLVESTQFKYVVIGNDAVDLDTEALLKLAWDEIDYFDLQLYDGGKRVAILAGEYGDEEIYTGSISGGQITDVSKIGVKDSVDRFYAQDSVIYYVTDDNDLYQYKNGEHERLAEDLYWYRIYEDGSMAVTTDYNYDLGFTLTIVDKSGNKTKISDDVQRFAVLTNGNVLFITDDTLKLYDGKEKVTVAKDAESFWTVNTKKVDQFIYGG